MKIEATTIDEFFVKSGVHEDVLRQTDNFICQHLPALDRKLYVSDTQCTLGYGEIPYKNTCYSGTLPILAIAPQKNNISLYVMAWKDGKSLAETYAGKLGKTSNGKGCIRFKRFADLDLEGLADLLVDVLPIYQSIKSKENQ